MKTKLLYLEDSYKRKFSSKVLERGLGFVVLEQTLFYPTSGGQPCDTGEISGLRVTNVKKEGEKIVHFISGEITANIVQGEIDWPIRYKHMRMHSAQHILSAIVLDKYGGVTCGNQIGEDFSRIDFHPLRLNPDLIDEIVKEFNLIVEKKIPVKKYFCTRQEVISSVDEKRRNLFTRIPESVQSVRVVEIEGFDKCPCAGTHVDNTSEIGHINIVKIDNKGKDTVRVTFELI